MLPATAKNDRTIGHILFFGTSGSGKSSLYKYFKLSDLLSTVENRDQKKLFNLSSFFNPYPSLRGSSFSWLEVERDFREARLEILRKLVEGTVSLAERLSLPETVPYLKTLQEDIIELSREKFSFNLSKVSVNAILEIWNNDVINQLYEELKCESSFFEYDHLGYFKERLLEYPTFGGKEWYPTIPDLVRGNISTTGIHSYEKRLDWGKVNVTDMGGAEEEKQFWEEHLERLRAERPLDKFCIVYVVPLGDYDVVCSKTGESLLDRSYNRYVELEKTTFTKYRDSIAGVLVYFNKITKFKYKYDKQLIGLESTRLPTSFDGLNWKEAAKVIQELFYNSAMDELRTYHCVGTIFNEKTIESVAQQVVQILQEKQF